MATSKILGIAASFWTWLVKAGGKISTTKLAAVTMAVLNLGIKFDWWSFTPDQLDSINVVLGLILVNGMRNAVQASGPQP